MWTLMISSAILKHPGWQQPGEVCLHAGCGNYLNSGFSEVDSACKVFPYKGIGVVCPLEDPL